MLEPPPPELSPEIRFARRLVESAVDVALLSDLRWFAKNDRWGMKCRITIAAESEFVPATTDWWVLVEPSYPWGDIRFYPARTSSISKTFPHQKYNGFEDEEWRSGEMCLRSPLFVLGREGYDIDPLGRADRMSWHFARAKQWLTDAANGDLLPAGDAFELPIFPNRNESSISIANLEDESNYDAWAATNVSYGTVEIIEIVETNKKTFVATRFACPRGDDILAYPIGKYLRSAEPKTQLGIWIKCDSMPVLAPYQAPQTWAELREAVPPLFGLLERAVIPIRDGESHILMLGFPVPKRMGAPPTQMHWQPVRLPILSHGTQHAPGFRAKTELGYWRRDLSEGLRSLDTINWQQAQNWSKQQASARGRYSESLADQSVGVLGVGAIGSFVAELLVRGGVEKALVVDLETLSHGNLCRHTLGMGSLDRPKAQLTSARLNATRATVNVDAINGAFPLFDEAENERIRDCTLIVECTGDDETLRALELYEWPKEMHFCSVSVGYFAKRVYIFLAHGTKFPFADFQNQIAPWLERDMQEAASVTPLRENVGCWHIAFPARIDQIVMAAAIAVRCLEEWAGNWLPSIGLRVFEQSSNGITEVAFSPIDDER